MDPQLLVALLSLFSTIQTNQSNRQLASEQRDWSESMQDKQNEYNTPAQQVQRLREAGISPSSLSMGNGMQIQGNTSAPVNAYERAQVIDPMQLASNSFLSIMQGMKSNAERKTEDSVRDVRVREIQNQADKYEAEITLLGLDARAQEIANEYAALLNEVAVAKDLSEIGVNESQAKNLDSLTEQNIFKLKNVLPQELQLLVDKHELNLLDQQAVVAEIQRIYSEVDLNVAKTDLTYEQGITEVEKQQNLQQDTSLKGAEEDDLRNRIKMYLDTYDDIAEQIASESKLAKRQVKGFWINTLLHGVTSGAAATGASAAMVKAVKALPK